MRSTIYKLLGFIKYAQQGYSHCAVIGASVSEPHTKGVWCRNFCLLACLLACLYPSDFVRDIPVRVSL